RHEAVGERVRDALARQAHVEADHYLAGLQERGVRVTHGARDGLVELVGHAPADVVGLEAGDAVGAQRSSSGRVFTSRLMSSARAFGTISVRRPARTTTRSRTPTSATCSPASSQNTTLPPASSARRSPRWALPASSCSRCSARAGKPPTSLQEK